MPKDHIIIIFTVNLLISTERWPTWRFGSPGSARFIESSQSSDGGAQNPPPKHGHRVHANELAHVRAVTAPQQRHDVRAHVVRVLFPKILFRCSATQILEWTQSGGKWNKKKKESWLMILTFTWYFTLPAKCWMTKAGSMTGVGTKYLLLWCCCLNLANNVSSVAWGKLWHRNNNKKKNITKEDKWINL